MGCCGACLIISACICCVFVAKPIAEMRDASSSISAGSVGSACSVHGVHGGWTSEVFRGSRINWAGEKCTRFGAKASIDDDDYFALMMRNAWGVAEG